MSEAAPTIEITAKAVERAVNPTDGKHSVRVRLSHTTPEGIEHEWNIWVPNEESFDRAVELARKELHRISVVIVGHAPASSTPAADDSQPDRSHGDRRNREWADKTKPGTDWVV